MAVDDQYTTSLLHFENGIIDESGDTWVSTGAVISTTQRKFGSTSLYLNGSSHLTSTMGLSLSSDDFTIDFWSYPTTYVQYSSPFASSPIELRVARQQSATVAGVYLRSNGSAGWDIFGGSSIGALNLNLWTHYALVRNGTSFYVFENGTIKLTATSSAAIKDFTNLAISDSGYIGYIDEFRISKGIARWTSNFTPPTTPYGSSTVQPQFWSGGM